MTMKRSAARKPPTERVVAAADFKAKCLALFDEVERGGTFIVTKRGRPVARVVPLPTGGSSSLRGSLLHDEDILAPVDMEWEAHR
jgi:prevent-host-death family protein